MLFRSFFAKSLPKILCKTSPITFSAKAHLVSTPNQVLLDCESSPAIPHRIIYRALTKVCPGHHKFTENQKNVKPCHTAFDSCLAPIKNMKLELQEKVHTCLHLQEQKSYRCIACNGKGVDQYQIHGTRCPNDLKLGTHMLHGMAHEGTLGVSISA